jgi:hypothetical protein
MSSATFDRFLKQLHAWGSDKGKGFDRSHFDGLSPDERLEAARLLRDALLRGDNTAVEGLVLLDPQAARATLDEALQKMSGDGSASLDIAEELWQLTGEPRYQDLMIAALRHPDHSLRRRALSGLQDTPHDDRLMAALQSLVIDDPNKSIRFWSATHLLYGLGLITGFYDVNHPHKQLVRDLGDESREVREKALGELKNRYWPQHSK